MLDQITLTPLQQKAIDAIGAWHKSDSRVFTLAGYAGSGKTTILKEITKILPSCSVATLTGKAAEVAKSKGISHAQTIHSLLYNYDGRDEDGGLVFSLKDGGRQLVIIDEYSMVSPAMHKDILARCNKILYVGDPGQLPPVGSNDHVVEPDFFLDKIMRQAADNPIISWAHKIREGIRLDRDVDDGPFKVRFKKDLTPALCAAADQVIVAKNKTKDKINNAVREELGRAFISNYPLEGEKLICRANNKKERLFNGYSFIAERDATDIDSDAYSLFIDGKKFRVWDGDIMGKDNSLYDWKMKRERVDFAYAITCHRAQGSEYDNVIVIAEPFSDYNKWLYTAVTRAKQSCVVYI